ncbi:MAG: tetratricopeptide repeat protein [Bacteroidales bacterium]|nr:tetratricopeptide repeat protein [Bacteroidales bacterium]
MQRLRTFGFFFLLLAATSIWPASAFSQNNQMIRLQPKQPPQNKQSSKEKLALSYYRSKEYRKAAELFGQLYAENPRQYYYTFLFNSLLALKEYKSAEKVVRKQIKSSPGSTRYLIDHAYVLKLTGNKKKSDKILADLIKQVPDNRALVIQLANAMQSKGFSEEALIVLQKARETPGMEYAYALEMANLYQYNGDYDKMFDAYLDYLDKSPQEMQRVRNRLQSLMRHDVDDNLSFILKKKLFERAQQNPDKIVYSKMLLWYSLQTKNFRMAFRQARAIDKRFGDHVEDMLEVAEIAMANHDFEIATEAYGYIKDKKDNTPFYHESYSGYFIAMVNAAAENVKTDDETYRELEKTGRNALAEIGLNRQTVEIASHLAHLTAFKMGNYDQAIGLLEQALEITQLLPQEKAGLKLELADILLFKGQEWDASLYYSQIEADMKNETVGHEAKFRNARLFYFMGEFQWAQTKLDILRSATSKLIANDAMELSVFIKDILEEDTLGLTVRSFGKADLLVYQEQNDSAFGQLNKIEKQGLGPNGFQYLLYKKANLLVKMQRFLQADSIYNRLVTSYPESIKADNAVYRQAEIQRLYLHDELKAMDLYMQLMRDYPESIYASQARIQYRKLREVEN